jgi:hypothetical protein
VLNLPDGFAEPKMYFQPGKLRGILDLQVINSQAMIMYGSHEDCDRTNIMLTQISSFAGIDDNKSPLYVPFAMKRSHPEIYGQYLAQQNAFLQSHRNIAIVGIHPRAMDYGNQDTPDANFPDSLWQTLTKMGGVYRSDSCRRTHDLGKWNISCHTDAHPAIAHWLYNNLVTIWDQITLDLPEITAFPEPERLSSRSRSSVTVLSGLTNASPVSHYLQSLAARHTATTKITMVVRNPWRNTPPVHSTKTNTLYPATAARPPLPVRPIRLLPSPPASNKTSTAS